VLPKSMDKTKERPSLRMSSSKESSSTLFLREILYDGYKDDIGKGD
jgi:hypothetical protein